MEDNFYGFEKFFNKNDKNTIKYIVEYIDKKYSNKRKITYDTTFYMSHIYYVLKTGIQWKALTCMCDESTIRKKFTFWNKNGIFNAVYNELRDVYLTNTQIKNTYIDASHSRNINGNDLIGRNHYDRYRFSTKLHLLIDENRVPISYVFTSGNVSDCKMTAQLTDILKNKITKDKRRTINIIGDKGYTNFKLAEKLRNDNIYLYTPLKSNNKKIKNTKKYNRKLKTFNRIIIENVFSRLDKFKRIYNRYEKLSQNFVGFHNIAFVSMIINKLK